MNSASTGKETKTMKQTLCAAACLAMLLASCGGGGGTSSPSSSQPSTPNSAVQRLVGGSPPVETAAEQDRRSRGLVPRADSYITAVRHVNYNDPDIRNYYTSVSCSRLVCTETFPDGDTLTEDLGSSAVTFEIGTTILTRNGITIEVFLEEESLGYEKLGAALDDSFFQSGYESRDNYPLLGNLGGRAKAVITSSHVYGERTSIGGEYVAPSVSGTWRGMMTAVTTQNHDLLLGDAVLQYSVSATGGSLSAEFSNIVNYSRNRAYAERSNVVFVNVPVRSDGTFNRIGSDYSKIHGAFYGDDHAEATGIIELRNEFLGAFGTKRAR